MPPLKILIVQTAFLGDVVLATALIEKLRRFYPEATLDFCLRRGNESLLAGHPHLRKLIIWDKSKKYSSLYQCWREIRRERYDWVINVQRYFSTGLLTAFSGARERIGYSKNPCAWWGFDTKVPHHISHLPPFRHEVERLIDLVAHRTDSAFERPRLYPSAADFEAVAGYKTQPYVCIAPSSVWATKMLPSARWADLIGRLPLDIKVFLLSGRSDRVLCERIQALRPDDARIEILGGTLNLLQSAALMADARMNYTNDSAPLHMAAAMNAPITAVYCSTISTFGFTPYSEVSHIVETNAPLACRPCGLHGHRVCPQGHFRCSELDVPTFLP